MHLRHLLRTQDGLVHRDQALEAGLSSSAIGRRVAAGDWEHVFPCVYRAVDHPWTPRTRLRAAGLWLGDEGTLLGSAATAWWRMTDDVPRTLRAALPPRARHAAPSGIRIERRRLTDDDRVHVDGVWVARRSLAVLEAASAAGLADGARTMDRALQAGSVTVGDLRDALDRTAGRHGTVLARRLVELADGGARSEAERESHRVLRRAGLRNWTPNHPVHLPGWGVAVLDIAFPRQRLAIEVDGWAFHRDVARFRRDALRQNEVVVNGWRVLRVTWYELREDPTTFVHSVTRALALAHVA